MFTPASPFTLAADTSYWIVVSNAGSSNFVNWYGNNPPLTPTGPDATFLGGAFSANGNPSPTGPDTFTGSFQVDGTAITTVPEPNSLALFGMTTLASTAYWGWRQRKQTRTA